MHPIEDPDIEKLPVRGQRTRCNARTRKGKAIAIAGKKLTPLKNNNGKSRKKNKQETEQEKKPSAVKKIRILKKKVKKYFKWIAYVQSTFNNTIISIADTSGNVISWASAGQW